MGKRSERAADLFQTEAESLGYTDERDRPERRPPKAALIRTRALGRNKADRLIVAQGRGGHTAALGELPDGDQVGSAKFARHGA